MCVAVRGEHFEDAVADFEHRDVEGAAAEVIHGDFFIGLAVEAVSEGCGGRLIDDAAHVEAGDLASGLRGVALAVVEVSRNRDDGFGDRFAELGFRVGFQLGEDHRADFLRAVSLRFAADFDLHVGVAIAGGHDLVGHALVGVGEFDEFAAHEALHGEDGVAGIGDGLTLGSVAHDALAAFGECDD